MASRHEECVGLGIAPTTCLTHQQTSKLATKLLGLATDLAHMVLLHNM